jgi:transposase
MHSMKHQHTLVIGGVDSHADTDHAAAMDQHGALLATKGFPTTTPGYRELLDWLCAFGEVDVVAVESTGSYAAALVRYLREHGVRVLEVNQPHPHTRRRRGKSDPIDAEMAARLALSRQGDHGPEADRRYPRVDPAAARSTQQRREVPQRRDRPARRTDHHRPARAPRPARRRKTIRGKAALCRRLRPSSDELCRPAHAAKFTLRSIAQRIDALDAEIAVLDRQLGQLVRVAAPRTIQLLGISTGHAGRLLVTA